MKIIETLNKLNALNRNVSFLHFRERNTRQYGHVMIGIGITMIMGFHFLDYIINLNNLKSLLLLRSATSIILGLLSLALFFSKPDRIRNKIHIYSGFYVLSVYSGFLSYFAGGIASDYWAGLNFILIFWLTLVPFTYKEIIANTIAYIFIYDAVLIALNTGPIPWDKFIEYHFFFSGTLMVGSTVTFLANINSAQLYINHQELEVEKSKLTARNELIEYGITLAGKIQEQLIPKPDPTEYIYSLYKPMQEVGGDLYDFVTFSNSDRIGIFISDVSGHGVPAAFITSMIKTTIHQSGSRKEDPAELMKYINDVLQNQTAENFITAFYGIFDPDAKTILYANAGHPQPYLICADGITQLPKGNNTALALFPNIVLDGNNKSYRNFKEIIPTDSKLLFYTDGLTEACPIRGNSFFENAVLMDVLNDNRNLTSRLFIDELYKSLISFRGGDSFEDDVCVVCLDVK